MPYRVFCKEAQQCPEILDKEFQTEGEARHWAINHLNMSDNPVIREVRGYGYGGFPIFKDAAASVYECEGCGKQHTVSITHAVSYYPTCTGKCREIINPHTARELVLKKQTTHKFVRLVQH